MNDVIEQFPVEKTRIKGNDSSKTEAPDPETEVMGEIERFPAEKRQVRLEEPPELIFFDVDGESEEADFIRVDDLFRSDVAIGPGDAVFMTLFPRSAEWILSGRISRVIRRTLFLSAAQLQCSVSGIRVRPHFVQWKAEPDEPVAPEFLARGFRTDLELQMNNLRGAKDGECFWSDNCFIWTAETMINDDKMNSMIELYRENVTAA